MEKLDDIFEVSLAGEQFEGRQLTIRAEQTTDGVPVYHCYDEGASIAQLRQETSGEWTQLWGDLQPDTVQQLGEAIASYNHQE
ncbi:hypothetical protein JHJ32_16335 [Parapedobacter sp. ISTM3]|uniref:hypothetical protein n=1 Tax=Parapedobacter sp. ISTM3 TaxID=2800130 RepID=UPI0019044FE4|nr:hypothetical protein [Parapedobacter sp. ISTM3]MBK1441568.1 hypothetical protein [Parapedobacter sp. ISTM3]